MSRTLIGRSAIFGLLLSLAVITIGCSQQMSDDSSTPVSKTSHDHDKEAHEEGHGHGGWWCVEHGIPEEECSLCSSKAAAGFKARGDWCEEHNRAESQCFKCDPSRAEKFAKLYKAKFGQAPPEPEE
ncbi:MAG: RND transporter [Planctomycetota bacterium]|nr:MAG: RND transporter [Planctomycetota bacterium]REJ88758.1 MAG: RND transporter [Planctomycetota bacterium]REK26599.1 MAG: RND transporter [Planctomycetota bacterium]REK46100.1 MAG: RND transporter [Planctomycetota bacterium]